MEERVQLGLTAAVTGFQLNQHLSLSDTLTSMLNKILILAAFCILLAFVLLAFISLFKGMSHLILSFSTFKEQNLHRVSCYGNSISKLDICWYKIYEQLNKISSYFSESLA